MASNERLQSGKVPAVREVEQGHESLKWVELGSTKQVFECLFLIHEANNR